VDNDSPIARPLAAYYPPDYLTASQIDMLMWELHQARVMEHQGNSYLAAWDVRAMLIRVFGFARWSELGTQPTTLVYEREITLSNGKDGMAVAYQAHRRLIVCAPSGMELGIYDGSSVGEHRMPLTSLGDCHDNAVKTAESGALKRAAINLGTQFGLGLYDHGRTDEVVRVLAWDPRPAQRGEPTPGTAVVVGGDSDLRTDQEAQA